MRDTDLEAVRLITMNLFDIVPFEEEKEIKGLGICSHPFATSLFIPDRSNNSLIDLRNPEHAKQYRMWIEEVVKNSSPSRILYRVEKAYRMTWFRLVSPYLSDADYGTLLKDSWITEEDPNQDKNVSQKMAINLFKAAKKEFLMDEEERAVYENLPDEITLYRGVSVGRSRMGLSWTNNPDVAVWYKKRFEEEGKNGIVLKATIEKKNVLAYFEQDNEIIVDTKHLKDVTEI